MLNKEIVEEYFVKTPLYDSQGRICPLPLEGEFILEEFRESWLSEQLPEGLIPMVSVGPKTLDDGLEGYSIRKEIVYEKQVSIPQPPYIQ